MDVVLGAGDLKVPCGIRFETASFFIGSESFGPALQGAAFSRTWGVLRVHMVPERQQETLNSKT